MCSFKFYKRNIFVLSPTLGLSDLICKAGVRAAVTWTYEDA